MLAMAEGGGVAASLMDEQPADRETGALSHGLTIGVAWNGAGDPSACLAAGLAAPFVGAILVAPSSAAAAEHARAAANSKTIVLPPGDSGIYDAWNKLVAACRTSHIAFHGIDDLVTPCTEIASAIAGLGPDELLVCSIQFATPHGKPTAIYHHRETVPPPLSLGRLGNPACPEVVWPVSAIRSAGGLDASFRIAGDADLWFRVRPRVCRRDCEAILLSMRDGGASTQARHARTVWLENRRIARRHGQAIPVVNRLAAGAFLNGRWLLFHLLGARWSDRLTDFARGIAGRPPRYSLSHVGH